MRRELADADRRLATLAQEISQRFPEYENLTIQNRCPWPPSKHYSRRTRPSWLIYLTIPNGRFLWLVRSDRAEMFRLDLTAHELEEAVRRLHVQLDAGQTGGRLVAINAVSFCQRLGYRVYGIPC